MTKPWSWEGARWWRCDLHVHTPASYDYKDRGATYEDWVAAVDASGVHVVAITDHNTAAGIRKVQDAAEHAGFVVFPGVELTVSPGVHLLGLFDPAADGDAVAALLGRCDLPHERFGDPDAISPKSVIDVMAAISGAGGLCIAAHEVKADDPALLQYVDDTHAAYGRPAGRLPQVRSSDAHELAHIGRASTWIKMTKPNLEGLRLALHDGELSVERHKPGEDPNRHSWDAIESITVSRARHIGRNPEFVLPLNPWLNALIGGRGTGKSSLVELLRAAMRRENELPTSLRQEWDDMIRVPASRGSRGVLTQDTVVTVVYQRTTRGSGFSGLRAVGPSPSKWSRQTAPGRRAPATSPNGSPSASTARSRSTSSPAIPGRCSASSMRHLRSAFERGAKPGRRRRAASCPCEPKRERSEPRWPTSPGCEGSSKTSSVSSRCLRRRGTRRS